MQELELIKYIINNFSHQTGLQLSYQAIEEENKDGLLMIPGYKQQMLVDCKKNLSSSGLQKYLSRLIAKNLISEVILLTEYINPNQANFLKENGLFFIDLAGNAYINKSPVYIDVQGKKPEKIINEVLMKKQLGKAFLPKGMKVVFMLLMQNELINKPMRTIANVSEVALGTVKQVIDDLVYQGFVVTDRNNSKILADRRRLQDKWLDIYPTAIEAKLNHEIYTTDNPDLLKQLDLKGVEALWGGEYAAQLYDNYLNAKDYLIYVSPKSKLEILKLGRLRKINKTEESTAIKVIVAETFLSIEKIVGPKRCLAHPLLVYANLIASMDARNLEAAGRLYEKYIA